MPDLAQELEKIILKAGIDGALTEDAVSQFHALVTERNALRDELKDTKRREDVANENNQRLSREITEVTDMLNAWATREKDLKDREEKVLRLELTAEFQEKRVNDHKEMMKTVFKPYHMRKSVYENNTEPSNDQYGGTVSTTKSKDTTVKEDEE